MSFGVNTLADIGRYCDSHNGKFTGLIVSKPFQGFSGDHGGVFKDAKLNRGHPYNHMALTGNNHPAWIIVE